MSAELPGGSFASELAEWYRVSARELPWREPGFSAWGILVSEIMLQQTPVARVIPRLELWLARWPTPADLAAASPGDAVRAWERLGYPRRALNLHAAAVAITERHHGIVPRDVPALLALPGVGAYTARAVATFAYGERHPVVDTNVRRVIARVVGGAEDPGPPSTRRDLATMEEQLPEDAALARVVSAAAMELGAIVCTARAPRCEACPVAHHCAWRIAGYPRYTGPKRATQKKYEGSDRQVRGIILAALRESEHAVPATAIHTLWGDDLQRGRALAGLLADGLIVSEGDGYTLP